MHTFILQYYDEFLSWTFCCSSTRSSSIPLICVSKWKPDGNTYLECFSWSNNFLHLFPILFFLRCGAEKNHRQACQLCGKEWAGVWANDEAETEGKRQVLLPLWWRAFQLLSVQSHHWASQWVDSCFYMVNLTEWGLLPSLCPCSVDSQLGFGCRTATTFQISVLMSCTSWRLEKSNDCHMYEIVLLVVKILAYLIDLCAVLCL